MSLQTPLLPPHDPEASASVSPVVDLETGGVIALHVPPGASELAPGTLPLLLDLPTHMVIGGSGALAPLHEALRRSGRRPRR
ncbi:hypothetical protein [Nonomuraea recticatena]|uniref:hypothetical protein n=1 Tax=Nonomuraea recticatena TaxID=46178 RepID=UPI00360CEE56